MIEALHQFITLVKNDDFVEGHEILETDWRKLKKISGKENEANILKGLINGSTALALSRLGKEVGAKLVWDTFEKYAPLIDTTPSEATSLFYEAKALLYEKHLSYM